MAGISNEKKRDEKRVDESNNHAREDGSVWLASATKRNETRRE